MRVACTVLLLPFSPRAESFAQAARNGTLQVTVVDETRGVLPGANVTLAGIEAANKAAAALTAATNPQGQATFENLAPGRYSIEAEFSGFQTRTLPDIRVRSGREQAGRDAADRPAPVRRSPSNATGRPPRPIAT